MQFKDDYFFLSTFYICAFKLVIDGKECSFTNAEAAYQAQKVPEIADKFSQVKGLEAKRIGEKLEITAKNWDNIFLYAMARALNAKFKDKYLFFRLKIIEGDIIYENPYGDIFWGVSKGSGKNLLGKLLTKIKNSDNDLNALYSYIDKDLRKELEK